MTIYPDIEKAIREAEKQLRLLSAHCTIADYQDGRVPDVKAAIPETLEKLRGAVDLVDWVVAERYGGAKVTQETVAAIRWTAAEAEAGTMRIVDDRRLPASSVAASLEAWAERFRPRIDDRLWRELLELASWRVDWAQVVETLRSRPAEEA